MACGLKGPAQRNLKLSLPAGCAYILSGPAQGRTGTCERGKVAHEQCGCCWTHGVANDASSLVRQSVTLRVYQKGLVLTAAEALAPAPSSRAAMA